MQLYAAYLGGPLDDGRMGEGSRGRSSWWRPTADEAEGEGHGQVAGCAPRAPRRARCGSTGSTGIEVTLPDVGGGDVLDGETYN